MDCPRDRLYSDYHLWVLVRHSGEVIIGLSAQGLDEIGAPDYVELPEPGVRIVRDEAFGVIETVKAAVDLPAPISGVIINRNWIVEESPGVMMESPYDEGWLVEARPDGPHELEGLMTAERYETLAAEARLGQAG
jgi:glycine cleavage system H protein